MGSPVMIQRKLPKPAAPAAADNKSADRELPQMNRKHFVRIPTVEIYPICKSELLFNENLAGGEGKVTKHGTV